MTMKHRIETLFYLKLEILMMKRPRWKKMDNLTKRLEMMSQEEFLTDFKDSFYRDTFLLVINHNMISIITIDSISIFSAM